MQQTRTIRLSLYILLLSIFTTISLAGRFESFISPRKRASSSLSSSSSYIAPVHYKVSWKSDGKRASIGSSAKTISYSSLAKTASITQNHINICTSKCSNSSNCAFVQVFQLSSTSYGSVVCSLHQEYVPSEMSTFASGSKSMGGKIKTTYGIRKTSSTSKTSSSSSTRKHTSTSSSSQKHTSTSTSQKHTSTSTSRKRTSSSSTRKHLSSSSSSHKSTITSTQKSTKMTSSTRSKSTTLSSISKVPSSIASTSSSTSFNISTTATPSTSRTSSSTTSSVATSTSTTIPNNTASASSNSTSPPATPRGATLAQLAPCTGTLATIPMFVNSQYNGSTTNSAYIVQHGHERDFDKYFSAVYKAIGENGIIIAPNSYLISDAAAPYSWFQPEMNLAWSNLSSTWAVGADAIAPNNGTYALNGAQCSSFDTYDAIVDKLTDTSLFPNLQKVYFVSHSGGANMVSRYSQINNVDRPFAIRYVLANSANNAYFTNVRPMNSTVYTPCSENSRYPYQWVSNGMPRYISDRFTNVPDIFTRWISRDVIILNGNLDTAANYPGGVQNCGSRAQGGSDRFNRNSAWWAYQNIIAGTLNKVTAFYGYQQLIDNGATVLYQSDSTGAGIPFNHQNCIVDNVGHSAVGMFSSPCGIAAMTQSTVPAGASPQQPPDESSDGSSSGTTSPDNSASGGSSGSSSTDGEEVASDD